MDIEGFEIEVLKDILPLMNKFKNMKLAICVYHRADHEDIIRNMVPNDYDCRVRNGYMIFTYEKDLPGNRNPEFPYFRHGVMRIERR